ncbi:MAG TPA: MFS transporter [Acidimicrobiia bacterium]|nr:MFS transporter [Acidimicrobiia bacterium]
MNASLGADAGPKRFLAYAVGGFGLGANSMVQFLLPLRADELGIGIGLIGVLLAIKAVVEAATSIPLGGFIDRVGARRALLIGTGGSALVASLFTVADSFILLAAVQIAYGVVRPLGWVGAQTYIAGVRAGADQATDAGRFGFVASSSHIVAPLLVGIGAELFGVRWAFLVTAAFSLIFFGISLVLADQPPGVAGNTRRSFGDGFRRLGVQGIQVAMLLTFARLWVPSVWIPLFPLVLVNGGTSPGIASSVVSVMGVVSALVSLSAGSLTRWARPEIVTAGGLLAGGIGLGIAPFIDVVPLAYLGSTLVGIGLGLSLPLLIVIVTRAAPNEQRGLALGLRSSVNQVASAASPVAVAGLIGAAGVTAGFAAGGGIAACFVAMAVLRAGRGERRRRGDDAWEAGEA